MLRIATSRFAAAEKVIESRLAPVRTTVAAPKFGLGFELAGSVAMLAPYGLFPIDDRVEFETSYRARLDRFGVEKIRRALTTIARDAGADGVVLLCFEDLTDQTQWCHRRIFAEWWKEQTRQEVLEL